MTKVELYRLLAGHTLGVVGSISADGVPQSALVGIAVTEDLEIVFDTLDTTRKYRNLKGNPKTSLVVGWDGEKTVQFEGDAFLPVGEELARYKSIYFAAWPEGIDRQGWPGLVYFVVRPRWIRFSNFEERPPRIEEYAFPD
jgi:general stress protein 26